MEKKYEEILRRAPKKRACFYFYDTVDHCKSGLDCNGRMDRRKFLTQGKIGIRWAGDDAARQQFIEDASLIYEELLGGWMNNTVLASKKLQTLRRDETNTTAIIEFASNADQMLHKIVRFVKFVTNITGIFAFLLSL